METKNTYSNKEIISNINKIQDEMDLLKLKRTEISQRINELKKTNKILARP